MYMCIHVCVSFEVHHTLQCLEAHSVSWSSVAYLVPVEGEGRGGVMSSGLALDSRSGVEEE